MTELHELSAGDVAGLIERRQVSPQDVLAHVLARVDAVNPLLNAVVDVDAEAARRQAEQRGVEPRGPLSGVPITIKDAIEVAGWRTTWGNPEWQAGRADDDAVVVSRLRRAGLVPFARSNVAVMLADFGQTSNPIHGRTNNPWDPARATGGSSGGAAAAVAAGLSYLDIGSDVVGSIRLPATFCGVYGLKPTAGIVPLGGFQPPGPRALPTMLDHMASLGPVARTPKDLRVALRSIAGPTAPSTAALTWNLPRPRADRLRDLRVGVVLDDPAAPVDGLVADVLTRAVDRLAATGATVRKGWPSGVDPRRSADTFEYLVGAFFAFKQGDPSTGPDLDRLVAADRDRRELQARWDDYFTDVDVFVCPTTVTTAPPHDDRPMDQRTLPGGRRYTDLASWVPHASLVGLPALSAPVGLADDGLPVGLQIIGPRYEDDTVLTIGELLAEVVEVPRLGRTDRPGRSAARRRRDSRTAEHR